MSKNVLRKQTIHIRNLQSYTLDLISFSQKINYILVSETTSNYFYNFKNVRDTNGFKRSSSNSFGHLSLLAMHFYDTGKLLMKRILDAYIFTIINLENIFFHLGSRILLYFLSFYLKLGKS